MGNKKDIGTIFKEKMLYLDKIPNENSWNIIQEKLEKKKKRKILLFWLIFSLCFFTCIHISIINSKSNFYNLNLLEKTKNSNLNNCSSEIFSNFKLNTSVFDIKNNGVFESNNNDQKFNIKSYHKLSNLNKLFAFSKNNLNTKIYNGNIAFSRFKAIKTKNKTKYGLNIFHNKRDHYIIKNGKKNSVDKIDFTKNITFKKNKKNNLINTTINGYNKKTKIVTKSKLQKNRFKNFKPKTKHIKNKIYKSHYSNNLYSNHKLKDNKKSSFMEEFAKEDILFVKNQNFETKNDCDTVKLKTTKKEFKKKIINKLTNKKDSIQNINKNKKTFTTFVYATPTKSVFLNNKSNIDNRLNNNIEKSETTLSYGLYICYNSDSKLTLRIGFGKQNVIFTTINAPINTPNYSNISYLNSYSNQSLYTLSNHSEYMDITQKISSFEIPLELKYRLINEKVGINGIIGFTYLFLNKNEVSVITNNGIKFNIGKSSDLLKNSFGANIGIGLDYKISKKIKINFEPMLKYQFKKNQKTNIIDPFVFNILTGLEFEISN